MSVRVAAAALCALLAGAGAAAAAPTSFVTVDGHRLYYECRGTGAPTVVLDAGSPDTTATWSAVEPALALRTRVCAYDRAGLGRSAPAPPGRRTALDQARDLRGLLENAKIAGPYVVVGHSWGGLLARLFAFAYPHETAGVVLVDATTFPYLSPALARQLPTRTNRERIDLASAVGESGAVASLGAVPLVVLGSNRPPLDAKLLQAQDDEAALSTDSVDAIARRSTHYLQRPAPAGQPDVVVDAVDAVVEAVRTGAHLPACSRLFAAGAVECR